MIRALIESQINGKKSYEITKRVTRIVVFDSDNAIMEITDKGITKNPKRPMDRGSG